MNVVSRNKKESNVPQGLLLPKNTPMGPVDLRKVMSFVPPVERILAGDDADEIAAKRQKWKSNYATGVCPSATIDCFVWALRRMIRDERGVKRLSDCPFAPI